MKLLLVEDNPADVRIIQEMLNDFPNEFHLETASRLDQALELVATSPFDAVLLDLGLPDSNGLETLTASYQQLCKMPIIVLTGLDHKELALEAVRLGAQDYLVKGQTSSNLLVRSVRYAAERKRIEQALQDKNVELEKAVLTKDRFLASMSHELRTPLNAIIGFTGTLLMELPGPLTEDQKLQLSTIQTSADHLLSLITDMLNLAKIESGKIELKCEPIVCQTVVEEVAAALRPLAESKGLGLYVSTPKNSVRVEADRRILSQILINLTNNAIKFTEKGQVEIALDTRPVNGHSVAVIDVIDTGTGIRPADKEKLFQAFQRVDVDQRSQGTGLGLYLSQKLAQLIKGKIELASEYGKGSVFSLLIPKQ